ncbi:MAG: hydrolase [Promicromonosporaceae bacterium]|nr:hydrolase [Promicromonosporaceae bacterium]
MTSITPIRDPKTDHLLTPENSALVIIDYQPTQVHSINSTTTGSLVHNAVLLAKVGKAFNLPIVLSTVNVANGRNADTIKPLKDELAGVPSLDRTAINAWEDREFYQAIQATGRKKLIMAALWTEACLTFPTLDALKEGFDVYPVVDAVGGTSVLAHETALRRVEQAGAHLITLPQLICELQRDWNRTATVKDFVQLLVDAGAFVEI